MDSMNNNSDLEMLKLQMKAVLTALSDIRAELEGRAMEDDGDLEWMAYMNDRITRLEDDMDSHEVTVHNLSDRVTSVEYRLTDVEDEFMGEVPDIATQIEDLYAEREMIWDESRDYQGGLLTIEDVDRIEEINRELEELESLGTAGVVVLEDDDTIQDIEKDLDQVYGDVYVMSKDVHGLRLQVESQREELNTACRTLEIQEDEIAVLQDRVMDLNRFSRDDVSELHDSYSELQDSYSELEASVAELQRRADAIVEGSIASLQETVAGLESTVEDLESKVYDIDELSGRVDDLEDLEYRLDNVLENGVNQEVTDTLTELRDQLDGLEKSTPSIRDFELLLDRVDSMEFDKPQHLSRRLESLENSRDYDREQWDRDLDEIINDLIDLRIWKRELENKSLAARLSRAWAAVTRFFPRISWKGSR